MHLADALILKDYWRWRRSEEGGGAGGRINQAELARPWRRLPLSQNSCRRGAILIGACAALIADAAIWPGHRQTLENYTIIGIDSLYCG